MSFASPMISSFERSPQRYVRLAGVMYLAIIVLGLFGEGFVRASLIASGDAGATFANIAASPLLWRAGIAGDLLMHVLDVPVIVIVYLLLRPVNEGLALLATFINLIGDARFLKAFSPEQLHAMSALAINMHGHGFGIGLIFFGFACLARGWLIFQSGYSPKALGVLMFAAGLSYLINSFALLLAPALADMIFPAVLVPAFIGELAFSLLIVKGVNVERWRARSTR